MGLFDFIKDAGAKLVGGDDADEPQAQPTAPAGSDPEEARRLINRRRSMGLLRHVQGLGLDVDGLQVQVDGDTATVRGKVPSQEEREKVVLAIGNTAGIARVDDRLEVETPEPEATFYTVKSGDTLSAIAKEHYGNAGKYMVIFEANRPLLEDPDRIYPGQVLRIPPLD